MFKSAIVLFLTVSIIMLPSCKKEKPKTVPVSEITMLVNGVDWKASFNQSVFISRFGDAGPCAGFYDDGTELTIFGLQTNGSDTSVLHFTLEKKPGVTGDYSINYIDNPDVFAFFYANLEDYYYENNEIYFEGTGSGWLKITEYNYAEGILSGTFEFDLRPNAANAGKPAYSISNGNINKLRRYQN